MRDYIDIGSSPSGEDCAQVGEPDYERRARTECARFIELIRKTLGEEPPGAHLAVKSNPHDFATYYEVVCYFQDDDPEATAYAFRCESDAPATWDAQPKPAVGNLGEVLQCADCGLVTADQERAARGAPCYRCGGEEWKVKTDGPPVERQKPPRRVGVCDSCLEAAAADYGIPDRSSQELLMVEMGADLADHLCDVVEVRDVVNSCACACRRR